MQAEARLAETWVATKGLLFDMDGVLISSTASVNRCWKQWCKLYGVANADSFEVPHGIRAVDIVRMLKPEFDEAQVAEALRAIDCDLSYAAAAAGAAGGGWIIGA